MRYIVHIIRIILPFCAKSITMSFKTHLINRDSVEWRSCVEIDITCIVIWIMIDWCDPTLLVLEKNKNKSMATQMSYFQINHKPSHQICASMCSGFFVFTVCWFETILKPFEFTVCSIQRKLKVNTHKPNVNSNDTQPNTRKTHHALNINTNVKFVLEHSISSTSKTHTVALRERQFAGLWLILQNYTNVAKVIVLKLKFPQIWSKIILRWNLSPCGNINCILLAKLCPWL